VRAQGEDTPSKPESSREEDEEKDKDEGEVNPPPHSLPCEAIHLLGDIFSRQAGNVVGARQPKWTQTEAGPLTGSPLPPLLKLVSPDL
jgi:hypothetical protein